MEETDYDEDQSKKFLDTHKAEDVKLPLVTEDNACFDFYSPEKVVIYPGQMGVKIGTGVVTEIPKGYYMMLFMRSSYGAKRTLRLSNCVGIIDSPYRGEIKAMFDNIGDEVEIIEKGDRFVQGLIQKKIEVEFEEVTTLTETQRGDGGFGSTGR
nr:MAG TPA: dUTPase [Caudoviricetes sp.]